MHKVFLLIVPLLYVHHAVATTCGDGSYCPSFATCCLRPFGGYACCPLLYAFCCADGIHCCPGGSICDVSGLHCLRMESGETLPSFTKFPSARLHSKANTHAQKPIRNEMLLISNMENIEQQAVADTCGDGSTCPSFATCCRLSSGRYGCCPIPNAVCCSDGVHCCQDGYRCDTSKGECRRGEAGESLPWFTKFPATRLHSKTGTHQHKPIRNEMLLNSNMDNIETVRISMRSNQQSLSDNFEFNDVVCPGQKFKCPSDTTCCRRSSGRYACCPMPNAVCCSDGGHCCPHGYRCDASGGKCLREETLHSLPWSAKFPATRLHSKDGTDLHEPIRDEVMMMLISNTVNIHDDSNIDQEDEANEEQNIEGHLESEDIPCGSSTKCTGKSTCCPVKNGEGKIDHMCCPHRNAVCCADFCCPHGYTCKANGKRCEKKAHPPLIYLVD